MTPTTTIQQKLDLAMRHQRAGEPQEADAIYRQIAGQHANRPEVLHRLGVTAAQAGRIQVAVELIRRTCASFAQPCGSAWHSSLLIDAPRCAQHGIGLSPDVAAVVRQANGLNMTQMTLQQAIDLAVQNRQAGRLDQAEAIYREILRQYPNHHDVLCRLGVLAAQTARPQEAVDLIGRAIAINPTVPEYHCDLGTVFSTQGNPDQSIACLQAPCNSSRTLPKRITIWATIGRPRDNSTRPPPASSVPWLQAGLGAGARESGQGLVDQRGFGPGHRVLPTSGGASS